MTAALDEAIQLTEQTCQPYTVISSKQELYKISVGIKWVYPLKYSKVIFRLRGMYLMMTFIGCVCEM